MIYSGSIQLAEYYFLDNTSEDYELTPSYHNSRILKKNMVVYHIKCFTQDDHHFYNRDNISVNDTNHDWTIAMYLKRTLEQ